MKSSISLLKLIAREMQYSRWNTLLSLLVVTVSTAMVVAMFAAGQASIDATRVMMKNMGFNLLITPHGIDPARYQLLDFSGGDMPEDYVATLANQGTLPAEHFVGKYQMKIDLNGETAILTGVMAEVGRAGSKPKPMPTAYEVKPGEVYLGAAIARRLNLEGGATLTLQGQTFKVARVLDALGAVPEDIRIFASLHEVQQLAGKPGRVNAIDALSCQCDVPISELTAYLSKRIRELLPDVEVTAYNSILLARHQQRAMEDLMSTITLSILMAAAAAAIWGLTYQNVHARRHEMGVLRALGLPAWRIACLFLGKIALYSLAGAALGCVAGNYLVPLLPMASEAARPTPALFKTVLVLTPLVAVLFGLPPVAQRLVQAPADILGERNG